MSALTALARLQAMRVGRAQPIADVRHTHLSDNPLVLVPLKLAGEAAAPLAVMVGTDPAAPTLLTVPQPRDRVLRLRFLAELAEIVLPYLAAYAENTEELTTKSGETYERCLDAPQLWVPNSGGVGFLKLLGRSVRFHRTEGDNPVPESIPLLGRWLTWFCDRAEHPGSSTLVPLTSVLSAHWATGQSALEDANLAALLGWIAPPPGSTGAETAARAEDPLSVPPAGPATDPGFDNEELALLIAAYDTAEDDEAKSLAARRIERALHAQVEPTWQLMWQGLALLRELTAGARVARRWNEDVGSFSYFAGSVTEGVPQARRDSAVSAVRKLLDRERALEKYEAERAFDDHRIMLEHRLAGTAFVGTVIGVDSARVVMSEKNRPLLRPILQVRTADPLVAAEGDEFCNVDNPSQTGTVLPVEGDHDYIVLELSGGMGTGKVARPGSVPDLGATVRFAGFKIGSGGPPAKLPAREDTPWTHGGPPPEWTPESEPIEEL
ncbi:hypothetical protein [Nocardia sp. NPDC050710]|uniref:hypothetical protein n=1 Tax=Nocardia sp. NPDC050710 TaxID=3157220 RepID=UPI0033F14C9B